MIFQSLAARYDLQRAVRHMCMLGQPSDSSTLRATLEKYYDGQAALYGKGRSALAAAIECATGGKGAVAITGLTCYSVVQAVEAAGCVPVYVDVEKGGLNIDPLQLEKLAKQHTLSAVIIQNTLGYVADIVAIEKIAKKHKLAIIEDLAHCAGAKYDDGRAVGTVGHYTMLSFGRDKALDTMNGGALIVRQGGTAPTQPTASVSVVQQLRDRIYPVLGWKARFLTRWNLAGIVLRPAYALSLMVRSADGPVATHERMPHWQARLALEEWHQRKHTALHRIEVAATYAAALTHTFTMRQGSVPVRFAAYVPAAERDTVIHEFKNENIHVSDIWYDVPVGPRRYFAQLEYPATWCPTATEVASTIVNLPTHTGIDKAAVTYIQQAAQRILE